MCCAAIYSQVSTIWKQCNKFYYILIYTTSKVIVSSKISKINCKKLLFRLSFSKKANSTFKVQEIFKIPVLSMRNWATKFCWFRSEPFSCPWSFPLDKSVTQIIFLKKRRNFYINYQLLKSRLSQPKTWQRYLRCLHFLYSKCNTSCKFHKSSKIFNNFLMSKTASQIKITYL